jgi:hypothetical protein
MGFAQEKIRGRAARPDNPDVRSRIFTSLKTLPN